jgi:hypothetical protein
MAFVRLDRRIRGGAALLVAGALMGAGCGEAPPSTGAAAAVRAALADSYEADCNDPDEHDHACTEPTRDVIEAAEAAGYPYYIGHAEPTAEFFSRAGTSGYNMQWKFQLPASEPSPTQDGSKTSNFELYIAHWVGLALCDPNSNPYGACTPLSDANDANSAGAAFLELQFYPPGLNCSNTQWCVRLHINTLQDKTGTQVMNCHEPTTQQYLTTDGTPGHTKLLMSNGDALRVTIRDTSTGLETVVEDLTSSTTGSMIASGANGFVHNKDQSTCDTEAFDFHAMYATAAPGQVVPWAGLRPNVSFDFEIGHFELCGNSDCSTLPDGDDDDSDCQTIRGVGGCLATDTDRDGTPYTASWPDGNASHPASFILGSPDDKGVGPMSALASSPTTFDEGYSLIKFRTTEATNTTFYPFFSQAGTGDACRFNFGNDIPGTTTNDFSKAAQYGIDIDNPCFPGVRETNLTYDGDTSQDFDDAAALGATLRDSDGKPVVGATISFMLGTQSCSGTTNALGRATCSFVITQAPGPATVTASYAGDAGHRAASTSAGFTILREESSLVYTGALTGDFNDALTVSAVLAEDGVTPLAGRTVTFALNGADTCTATTDAAGVASCSITPSEPAGTYPLIVSFAGDTLYLPTSTTVSFVVTLEEDTLTSTTSLQVIAQNGTATFSATLLEDGVTPILGRTVTITLGSGAGAQSCAGLTNALGVATCTISPVTVPIGPQPVTDSFVSDGFYRSATNVQQALVFGFLDSGAFVLGDATAASALGSGATVTWWGAHWAAQNLLSGGSASPSFKGFAATLAPEPPVCGGTWTSGPGDSADPPVAADIPAYMGVVVSSQVTKSGSTLSGANARIVVVKVAPGYGPDPGHAGTGQVVAEFCP